MVLEGRAQPEVEAKGRSRHLQAKGRCGSVSGEGRVAPSTFEDHLLPGETIVSGLGSGVFLYWKMKRFEARVEYLRGCGGLHGKKA